MDEPVVSVNDPVVSVVMSVRNGDAYLAQALSSILGQSYESWEAVVTDNGSTDSTPDILRRFASRDKRVKIISQDDLGLPAALNIGIRASRGRYVARLDADDSMNADRLALQVRHLDEHPEVGMVGSAAEIADEAGDAHCRYVMPTEDSELRRALIRFNPFFHSSVMFRRQVVEQVGGYDETCKAYEDYDLWIRVAHVCQVANLPHVLVSHRRHDSTMSNELKRSQLRGHLRTQWMAIRRGWYSPLSSVHMARPLLFLLMTDHAIRLADLAWRRRSRGGVIHKT